MSDSIKNFVKDASKVVYKKVEEEFAKKSFTEEKIADLKLRSHIGKQLDYGYFKLIGNQSISQNYIYKFEKVVSNNIEYDENGYFYLKANKIYQINCDLTPYANSKIALVYAFYEGENNTQISELAQKISNNYTTSYMTNSSINFIYKPTTDCYIYLKETSNNQTSVSIDNFTGEVSINEIGREVLINEVEEVAKNSEIEDTPVGSILGTLSLTAPTHYLLCDGTEYNIEDYPKLAQYFKDTLGSINYYGGDGTNTFAVPDFRGEFIRGYDATNVRDPQGSTRGIGKHQDATDIVLINHNVGTDYNNIDLYGDSNTITKNIDKVTSSSTTDNIIACTTKRTIETAITSTYNARPTNVNVLWCIKYEPTYFMNYSPIYMGFNETVLFDGEANAVGEYSLNDLITDYNYIKVYSTVETTQSDSIEIRIDENLSTVYITGVFDAETYFYSIRFNLANNKLNILEIFKGSGWNSYNPKIYKIIGIKNKTNDDNNLSLLMNKITSLEQRIQELENK